MKQRLARAINTFLVPSRESRRSYERDHGLLDDIAFEGNRKALREAQKTRAEAWQVLKLYRPKGPAPGHAAQR